MVQKSFTYCAHNFFISYLPFGARSILELFLPMYQALELLLFFFFLFGCLPTYITVLHGGKHLECTIFRSPWNISFHRTHSATRNGPLHTQCVLSYFVPVFLYVCNFLPTVIFCVSILHHCLMLQMSA